MTQSQFIEQYAAHINVSKSEATRMLKTLAEFVISIVTKEDEVTLPGIAKITKKVKPAKAERQGVNPFTKEKITIKAKPASKKVCLKPVKGLKEAIQ